MVHVYADGSLQLPTLKQWEVLPVKITASFSSRSSTNPEILLSLLVRWSLKCLITLRTLEHTGWSQAAMKDLKSLSKAALMDCLKLLSTEEVVPIKTVLSGVTALCEEMLNYWTSISLQAEVRAHNLHETYWVDPSEARPSRQTWTILNRTLKVWLIQSRLNVSEQQRQECDSEQTRSRKPDMTREVITSCSATNRHETRNWRKVWCLTRSWRILQHVELLTGGREVCESSCFTFLLRNHDSKLTTSRVTFGVYVHVSRK